MRLSPPTTLALNASTSDGVVTLVHGIRSRSPGAKRSSWCRIALDKSPPQARGTWAYVQTGLVVPLERRRSARYCWPTDHQGPRRHLASCDVALGRTDLFGRGAHMDGADATDRFVGPRDVDVDGEVELERTYRGRPSAQSSSGMRGFTSPIVTTT